MDKELPRASNEDQWMNVALMHPGESLKYLNQRLKDMVENRKSLETHLSVERKSFCFFAIVLCFNIVCLTHNIIQQRSVASCIIGLIATLLFSGFVIVGPFNHIKDLKKQIFLCHKQEASVKDLIYKIKYRK